MIGKFKLHCICFIIFLLSCNNHQKLNPPEKPTGIPTKAFWVGGVDGGNWYLIEQIKSDSSSAFIKIYNDQDGSLIESKSFHLRCDSPEKINWQNLELDINSFDGQRIFIKQVDKNSKNCFLE